MPFENVIGISRKISSVFERKRLRHLAKSILPSGAGCIIRTAAAGKTESELVRDLQMLSDLWKEIEAKVKKMPKPGIVYQDMELATSVIRDLFTKDVEGVSIDSKKLYKEITNYLKWASPHLVDKVEFYNDKKSIFEHFGIEKRIRINL